jgi:UDP-N-acetylmuramate dehydrogenase
MALIFASHRKLSEFSTFGIGGPILHFAEAKTFEDMREGVLFALKHNFPFLIIGKGSNCLFDDRGFSGVVLLNKIDFCEWNEASAYVGSGYSFSLLGSQSARKAFSGLEFASGIPASVGGAIFMNAGANGKETFEALKSVVYLTDEGHVREYKKQELNFGYRRSSFHAMRGVILAATFVFCSNSPTARSSQLQMLEYRKKTQPIKEKSIGCIFRNPCVTQSAGSLIDRCGLKGVRVGGAKVSEIHANFIVNECQATAADIMDLMSQIQTQVFKITGVHLEPEVRLIPYES